MPEIAFGPVILPVIALVLLGFVVARLQTIDLRSIASLAIYVFTPIVGFGAAAQLTLTPSLLILPVLSFAIATLVGLACLCIGEKLVCRNMAERYLLPIATGSGNTGYFGLPLAVAVLGEANVGVYLLGMLGVTLYESTIGYYFVSRGTLPAREAFKRATRLPLLYALVAGLIASAMHIQLSPSFLQLWSMSRGAYVCIGMMIVGIALAQAKGLSLNLRLVSLSLVGKFILWPIAALGVVMADRALFAILSPVMAHSLILLSVVPMAANLCAYAAQHNFATDRAASLVLLSTALALIALPVVIPYLLAL